MTIDEYKSLPGANKKKTQRKEESLQIQVSAYIRAKYPDVIFTSESSGVRVSMGTAIKMKKQRSNHKLPDMIILHPMNGYCGLCIELKKEGEIVWLKNGSLSTNKHIQEQAQTLSRLGKLKYCADFAIGYNQAILLIDRYFSL